MIFVLPLVIVLFLAGNKSTTEKITKIEQSSAKNMKLFIGLFIAAVTKSLMYPLLAIAIAFFMAYGVAIINGVATAVI